MIDKHEKEVECFQHAVHAALKNRGETKRIMKYLDGETVSRKEEERPDIVKLCKSSSRGQKDTIVGIEHFRVDHLSLKKKDKKVASTGIVAEKKFHDIFNTWHDEVVETDNVPDEAVIKVIQGLAEQMERIEKASYHTYIEAFKYSLNQHIKNIDIYRENLLKIAKDKYNIQVALFIEVHMEFNNLYLNDTDGKSRLSIGQFPIFGEIVRMLEEKIDKKKIDYIVFCLGDTLYSGKIKVIAVKTGNITKNLVNQGVQIYEYAGEDMLLFDFQSTYKDIKVVPQYTFKEDQVDVIFRHSTAILDEKQRLQLLLFSFKQAWELKKNGHSYATTVGVQMLMECFGDYVIGWKRSVLNEEESWLAEPIFSPLAFVGWETRMDEFEKRWFPRKKV